MEQDKTSQSQPVTATPSAATSGAEPSAAFTPGPWRLHINNPRYVCVGPVGPEHLRIAQCSRRFEGGVSDEQAEANARLIAAAPDLLEAGNELSEAISDLAPYFEAPAADHLAKWERLDRAQKAWRAVLAKATEA